MDLKQLTAGGAGQFTDQELSQMSHGELMYLRKALEKDRIANTRLAPFEHQAFAREYTKQNPVSGALGIGAAIPVYALAKSLGFMQNGGTATPTSLNQITAGYRGIGQGLGITE